jgi:hypothetical protein
MAIPLLEISSQVFEGSKYPLYQDSAAVRLVRVVPRTVFRGRFRLVLPSKETTPPYRDELAVRSLEGVEFFAPDWGLEFFLTMQESRT